MHFLKISKAPLESQAEGTSLCVTANCVLPSTEETTIYTKLFNLHVLSELGILDSEYVCYQNLNTRAMPYMPLSSMGMSRGLQTHKISAISTLTKA